MVSRPPTSPACALHEAPDDYRGYLPPAEVAAILQGMIRAARKAGREDLAARLRAVTAGLPAPAAAAVAGTADGADFAAAFAALLPRIRDNRLHAALAAIRDDPAHGLA